MQVEAIKNIQIDKITVWDTGSSENKNGNSTSHFMSNLVKSLPALHDIAGMAGLDLPTYLGSMNHQTLKVDDTAHLHALHANSEMNSSQ